MTKQQTLDETREDEAKPLAILKDYYFPVTIKGFEAPMYVTVNDSFNNGIPNHAYVLKVSAQGTSEFNVCCCVHSPCGWKLVDDASESPPKSRKKQGRKQSGDSPSVDFEMMVRVYSPSGQPYSGFKRPRFHINLELYKKSNKTIEFVSKASPLVEAVTKISKQALNVELSPVDEPPALNAGSLIAEQPAQTPTSTPEQTVKIEPEPENDNDNPRKRANREGTPAKRQRKQANHYSPQMTRKNEPQIAVATPDVAPQEVPEIIPQDVLSLEPDPESDFVEDEVYTDSRLYTDDYFSAPLL